MLGGESPSYPLASGRVSGGAPSSHWRSSSRVRLRLARCCRHGFESARGQKSRDLKTLSSVVKHARAANSTVQTLQITRDSLVGTASDEKVPDFQTAWRKVPFHTYNNTHRDQCAKKEFFMTLWRIRDTVAPDSQNASWAESDSRSWQIYLQ